MMRAARGKAAVALLAGMIELCAATTGRAHDSLAPLGAKHTWLPKEDWVARHWIPFDEQALRASLRLRGRELEAYLYEDHRTLAALARRRGLVPEQLADRLVAPWGLAAGDARLAILRDRALRVLTQGHLAQHLFFHVFHGVGVRAASTSVFGVSGDRYWRLRKRGRTPLEIARVGGVSSAAARSGMIRLLRAHRDAGVRSGDAWPSQSDTIFERQMRDLDCWLQRPMAGSDRANPYGKTRLHHGRHRGAEHVRRALPPSCWRPPPAWSGVSGRAA